MAANPRDHVTGKGFWDGGAAGHGENGQSGGRTSGYPGVRSGKQVGIRTDLEFPATPPAEGDAEKTGGSR